ncbi:hypothetical protein J6590_086699 [Homalodisca vitripennis]|nr:hypothetical protein J6590_086699 [Homalodisca vitripennis]
MDIGDRVDSIESGIASNVESAKSLAGSSQVDVSLVVLEVNERLLRSKNIMIFGLPESLMTNPNEKRESDKRNIEAILSSADPNSNSSSLRFFRVGKGSASKPRPLKVIIGCAERVNKILKACTKDVIRGLGPNFSNISLARDKTKQELAHLDHLRKELSRRLKEVATLEMVAPILPNESFLAVADARKMFPAQVPEVIDALIRVLLALPPVNGQPAPIIAAHYSLHLAEALTVFLNYLCTFSSARGRSVGCNMYTLIYVSCAKRGNITQAKLTAICNAISSETNLTCDITAKDVKA